MDVTKDAARGNWFQFVMTLLEKNCFIFFGLTVLGCKELIENKRSASILRVSEPLADVRTVTLISVVVLNINPAQVA